MLAALVFTASVVFIPVELSDIGEETSAYNVTILGADGIGDRLIRNRGSVGAGFGDGKDGAAQDLRLLSGVRWFYSWGLIPRPSMLALAFEQEFVAMVWGKKKLLDLASWVPHQSTTTLLGFNEPNLHGQSNLTAAEACAVWPQVTAAAKKHSMKVGSPAANHCNPGGSGSQDSNCFQTPEDWFDDFFALPGCGTDTVDIIATHKYGCNASDTVEYVKMLHARYGKPIWLTEFSCGHAPVHSQLAFMKQILPIFDAMAEVIPRYAWFVARDTNTKHSANDVLIEGGSLTVLGEYLNSSSTAFLSRLTATETAVENV